MDIPRAERKTQMSRTLQPFRRSRRRTR